MRKQKQITSSIIILALIFAAVGCSKFLDRPLENQTKSNIDYTNLSLMYQPVAGAYSVATRGGYASWVHTFLRTSQSDDIIPYTSYPEVDLINQFQYGPAIKSFWAINDFWSNYYGVIIASNGALAELDEFGKNIPSGDNDNTKLLERYKAECRFWAGLGHYWLSRYFGDVPILAGKGSLAPAYLDTVHKSSLNDVRKYVMSEMDFCIANLEDARPNQAYHKGGVTKYTALMLKAKAAMDMAGNDNASPMWDVVLDCTNQIISSNKFSLFEDFYQLFKKPGKLCDESILEFMYSDFGAGSGDIVTSGFNWGAWSNLYLFQGPDNKYGAPINGPGWLVPTQKVVDFLTDRKDSIRLKTTIQYCGINGDPNTYKLTPDGDTVSGNGARKKYFNGKAYFPKSQMTSGRNDYGANNNIRVFRYSEVLLMNAEAKIRKGQNGDEPFNLVRKRIKLNPITNVNLDQLLDERHAEFACEWWGERFNDMVRTDRAATQLTGFIKGKSEFLPIPQAQEDRNSNLK
ncbi:RagB/SusD family nutrient uptake outer membrane protein [Pseudoflavitalea sp. G-6-1-2]|uniref:RagB/SusD family nutrient uptake outer membrane protein n=1 Tax=Pseudoflavitalea sp. G-6-1-2 TaxID=2728841 RepID=UPI00146B9D7A|nr:RagB/SusD family nutrient uptake outer membrane protein [Pseudoflavitalea sp. G-6-1-2]NML21179.1 RagB/SusD family nutrient uptake outer membrane protein [Pseudoflavitalea sp. G-6-1-2]